MKEENIKYIPCIPQPVQIEEDEIDLKEIIKTILKYKKFIFIFTLIITLLAGIYAFIKKPIYEIKAYLQIGYIGNSSNSSNNSNSNSKIYLLEPNAVKIYIKNNFDKSSDENITYPKVNIDFVKNTNDILNIKIQDFSNKSAISYLHTILTALQNKENKKLTSYIKTVNSQIKILNEKIINSKKQIKTLNKNLKYIKDPNIYQITLNKINDFQNDIARTKLQINDLKAKISPLNITRTNIIGQIQTKNHPIKPKKKLIITVAFITGFILSTFLVFFIEFIKSLKEK